MATPKEVRDAGRSAVQGFRRSLAQRAVDALENHDPELLDSLVEVGVVRKEWVEEGTGPMSTSAPLEVVERLLERSVERRPSLLSRLGLSTIQVLSTPTEEEGEDSPPPVPLAVAFTDLEGFTRFTSSQGDEAASHLLADHHKRVGPIVRSRGGRVVKRLGDGLLLTFPEPEAGVLACLELVDAHPDPLRLRAGLHFGDVVILRDDIIGHVVNVAARVAESAKGGEVLATTEVRQVAGESLPQVTFGRARRRYFKGIDEAVSVCPVTR
jgi:adenylate cyclase